MAVKDYRRFRAYRRSSPFKPNHWYFRPRPKPAEVMIQEDPFGKKFIWFGPGEPDLITDLEYNACCAHMPYWESDTRHVQVLALIKELGTVNIDLLEKALVIGKVNARKILNRLHHQGILETVIPGYYRLRTLDSHLAISNKSLDELDDMIEQAHEEYESAIVAKRHARREARAAALNAYIRRRMEGT